METKNEKFIQSVTRAIQILQCFDKTEELGVTEIGKMLELHKSTAFGLINTLEVNKLLEKNEDTGKYRLGLELFRLGTKVNSSLRHIAIPYLENLVKMYQETVNLVILDDTSVIYLEKVESTHSMRISTLVGGRLPLYCTAVGKAILSGMTDAELENKLKKMEFKRYTENTLCEKDALLKSIQAARIAGYALEKEELEHGLSCVAAPLYNHLGQPFGAISVSGPASRMTDEFKREIGETLLKSTIEISKKLGWSRK